MPGTMDTFQKPKPKTKTKKDRVEDEKPEQAEIVKKEEDDNSITVLSSTADSRGQKRKWGKVDDERKQKMLQVEELNHYRNVHHIKVVGKKVPDPARSFGDLNVEADLIENLRKCDCVQPTLIQQQGIPVMLEGRHLLATAPTGSGKTAAFLIPIIHHLKQPESQGFRALVLCPTRELVKQIQRQCFQLSEGRRLKIHTINKIKRAANMYGPESSQKFDILITTPNRLCFLLKQDPPAISLANIQWLIIDEADELFESGTRSFRDQLEPILKACTNEHRKIAMFGATQTPVVTKWCVRNMKNLVRITIGHRNSATDSVRQKLVYVGREQGKLLEMRQMIARGIAPPVLIFVQSKERAQQLFHELQYDGIKVDAIHADRTQAQRHHTVKCFREQSTWVLISTELMARGMDFKGVNLIINYDFPPSARSYVHRVGRAGRAGLKGEAVTFWTDKDVDHLRSIAYIIKEAGGEVPDNISNLNKKSKRAKRNFKGFAPKRERIDSRSTYKLGKRSKKRSTTQDNNVNEGPS